MSRRWLGLAASVAVVILINVLILTGVARNRSATPEARVELTERECPLAPHEDDDEDTGLSLSLAWQTPDQHLPAAGTPRWINRDTLRGLGFDVSLDPADPRAGRFYSDALPRDAFVVLEMDGFAWKRWIAAREATLLLDHVQDFERKEVDEDRRMGSHLIAVALGRDAEALRGSYPDRSRFLILPVEVHPSWYRPVDKTPFLDARVSLRTDHFYAPLPFRPLLDRFQPPSFRAPKPAAPRYRLTLAVGRGYEPWLETVESLSR